MDFTINYRASQLTGREAGDFPDDRRVGQGGIDTVARRAALVRCANARLSTESGAHWAVRCRDAARDQALRMLDESHLFERNMTRIALLRGHNLRGFAFRFIELCAPALTERVVRVGMEAGAARGRCRRSGDLAHRSVAAR